MTIKSGQTIKSRFRGFLPVVVDIESGGFNAKTDALLEIAVSIIRRDENNRFYYDDVIAHHIIPFEGSNLDPKALEFNKIDPFHPFRFAIHEHEALADLFSHIGSALRQEKCQRAVLVGHNPQFDLTFLRASVARSHLDDQNPFHSFTTFDTATLCALVYGHTVLAQAAKRAGVNYDKEKAHSARYDVELTAELFCKICNAWDELNRLIKPK